jgi:acetyltransferase-like isoleucine patch superfamily enzyme
MNNTLFNTSSGHISVGEYAFAGHDVSVITGTHDHHQLLKQRFRGYPESGRDIVIGAGVWLGSGAIILGPCTIGDHAIVAAGAVIKPGSQVSAGAIFGGNPAKQIGQVPLGADE